jgi:hypothetical protein
MLLVKTIKMANSVLDMSIPMMSLNFSHALKKQAKESAQLNVVTDMPSQDQPLEKYTLGVGMATVSLDMELQLQNFLLEFFNLKEAVLTKIKLFRLQLDIPTQLS